MLRSRPAAARPARRLAAALAASLLVGASALAAPDTEAPPADPLLRLLADKSLASTPPAAASAALVDRVRDRASDMVLTAMNFLGVPYKRGGSDADHGFDCSGFTRHIFEKSLGLVLPRRADEQATSAGLLRVGREELRPGDLVFFNTMRRTFSHVGIYLGDGRFIHSPKPGGEVRVDDLHAVYWERRFTGARRAEPDAAAQPVRDSGGPALR